jgi:hypothetical protein
MRQLDPERDGDRGSAPTSQAQRLRQEISRYRQRLAEADQPETLRVFEMLMNSAQAQLEQIEDRVPPTDPVYPAFSNAANPRE